MTQIIKLLHLDSSLDYNVSDMGDKLNELIEAFNAQTLAAAAIPAGLPNEPQQVITIRVPKSVHRALQEQAHDAQTSMNKLCLAKLQQPVNVSKHEVGAA